MNKLVILIVVLTVYSNDVIIHVDAQSPGVAKAPFSKSFAYSPN